MGEWAVRAALNPSRLPAGQEYPVKQHRRLVVRESTAPQNAASAKPT